MKKKQLILKITGWDFGPFLENRMGEWAWLLLRVFLPLCMLVSHGWGKLIGFSNIAPGFVDPYGLGPTLSLALVVGAEFFGSLFLMAGLFSRWTAFSLLFTMLTAAFLVHFPDPFKDKEMALIYAIGFAALCLKGGGKYSLDALLKKKL